MANQFDKLMKPILDEAKRQEKMLEKRAKEALKQDEKRAKEQQKQRK